VIGGPHKEKKGDFATNSSTRGKPTMSRKMLKKSFVTPKGYAAYAHIKDPDTKFNSDGVYSVKLRIPQDEAEELIEQMDKYLEEAWDDETSDMKPGKIKKMQKVPAYEVEMDDETGEETGYIVMNFRANYKITTKTGKTWFNKILVADGQGKAIKNIPNIGNGSTVRVSCDLVSYTSKDTIGVSRRLKGIQIIDLVEYGDNPEALGFGAEDGAYVHTDIPQDDDDVDTFDTDTDADF
jgi:hypothetical protein